MSKKEIVSQLQTIVRVVGPNALALSVHVKPNAKKAGIAWEEEQLNIKLNSPPVDNKANKEVCDVIAKMVDVPKGQVSVIRGGKSKEKEIQICGTTVESVLKRIVDALDESGVCF